MQPRKSHPGWPIAWTWSAPARPSEPADRTAAACAAAGSSRRTKRSKLYYSTHIMSYCSDFGCASAAAGRRRQGKSALATGWPGHRTCSGAAPPAAGRIAGAAAGSSGVGITIVVRMSALSPVYSEAGRPSSR